MTGVYSAASLARLLRQARSRISEVAHVGAVYLGIAVAVTLAVSATVPSLREQLVQVHEALLVGLRPSALGDAGLAVQASKSPYGLWSLGAMASRDVEDEPVQHDDNVSTTVDTFADALYALDDFRVPGVSSSQSQALRSYIARKYRIAHKAAGILIHTAFQVGDEQRLDPQLLLAVIAIESRYNPFAESHVGAQGLMQVMTRVHQDKFERLEMAPEAALDPITNIRVGAQILRDCIDRRGSVKAGLACYVGATGPSDGGYGAKVMAEWRRIALASGVPIRNL